MLTADVERVKAKGEIKLTFSSTLGGGGTSSGVEQSVKVDPERQTAVSSVTTTTTASHADLGDADDIVSEFLGQINHASMGALPLAADGTGFQNGPQPRQQQRRPLSGVQDGPSGAPASFIYEPDSGYGGGRVDAKLLPGRLSGAAGDMGGGPAAETLKKMAALHRRLEENTGNGSTNQLLPTTADYDHGYKAGRHALSYQQVPVSYCNANGRCGMVYGVGASKPLSHYPASPAPGCALPLAAFPPHYAHQAPETVAGPAGSSFYMTQSQCVDFRLSQPCVEARATMSQSTGVRSASPYHAAQTLGRAAGCPYGPQSRGYSGSAADDRSDWMSTPYARPARARDPSAPTAVSASQRRRVLQRQAYAGNHDQSFDVLSGASDAGLQPPPPPAYSDFVQQKQRVQFDQRKWNPPSTAVESTWRRRPWNRHQDFNHGPAATPADAPTPASGHVTSGPDVDETFLGQEFFYDAYSSSNLTIDNTDFSFIDDLLNGP